MKAMQQHWYDVKSLLGAGFTLLTATFAGITAQEWAAIVAVLAGLTTTGYTIWKWRNDVKNKK